MGADGRLSGLCLRLAERGAATRKERRLRVEWVCGGNGGGCRRPARCGGCGRLRPAARNMGKVR